MLTKRFFRRIIRVKNNSLSWIYLTGQAVKQQGGNMMATETYKVVVYGADLPGVFAAAKAAAELTSSAANGKVALIVPYPKTTFQNQSGGWRITCWVAL